MIAEQVTDSLTTITSQSAREAIRSVASRFEECGKEVVSEDPLSWPGYRDQVAQARELSGENEAVVTGEARVGGTPVVIVAFDFNFLGGSVGEATGHKIVDAFALAREIRKPVVSLVATGGARMQEGMRSLVQMQRIANACTLARADGIPHISVLRHPTTGGVWASLAASADFVIGVKGAAASFAGSRVRETDEEDEAFTSAGKLRNGFIDMELEPEEVPEKLAAVAGLLSPDRDEPLEPPELPAALGGASLPRRAWASVMRARRSRRPRVEAYLERYFEHWVEISGDRAGGVDESMQCGFGCRKGRTIAYAAQTGTANSAAGFRTAKRQLEMAERLQLPVLTLIDTPGAGNRADDEWEGVGTAIADLLCTVADLSVPITSLVIGEGGSGGALALAAPDNLWITPDGYFAVISPESAAAILERDPSKSEEISERMRLRPQDLVKLGVVRGITPTRRHPARVLRMSYDAVRSWAKRSENGDREEA
jgi:acetyl-CoA carboxylase beta subunit